MLRLSSGHVKMMIKMRVLNSCGGGALGKAIVETYALRGSELPHTQKVKPMPACVFRSVVSLRSQVSRLGNLRLIGPAVQG